MAEKTWKQMTRDERKAHNYEKWESEENAAAQKAHDALKKERDDASKKGARS